MFLRALGTPGEVLQRLLRASPRDWCGDESAGVCRVELHADAGGPVFSEPSAAMARKIRAQ